MEYTVFWNVPFCIISTFTFGTLSRLYFDVNGFVLLSKNASILLVTEYFHPIITKVKDYSSLLVL